MRVIPEFALTVPTTFKDLNPGDLFKAFGNWFVKVNYVSSFNCASLNSGLVDVIKPDQKVDKIVGPVVVENR